MYYTNGNYEAFARPRKPVGVDQKSAYIIGSGLASLAAASFLVRDGQMAGERIHVLEELPLPGGSLDGAYVPNEGFVLRGGREMENHFECLWDLFRSIPSLEIDDASVLDEFYWLNKDDPNFSRCRIIRKQGQRIDSDGKMVLSDQAQAEIIKLCLRKEEDLDDVTIEEVFSEEFFESNFWIYWKTMFAFEPWHSAMEMRRYLMRFIHHIAGIADFSALKFTKYNQYESLVLPLVAYLEEHGVEFVYDTRVDNIVVNASNDKKVATQIEMTQQGEKKTIDLTQNDLVFVTNGSITESTTRGDNQTPAPPTEAMGGSWKLWRNLAAQDKSFGRPEKFYQDIPKKAWFVSATTTTLDDKIPPYIEKICQRDPFSGKTVTGGIVTVTDSKWQLSFTLNRQPQFKAQADDQLVVWIYALYSDVPGDYIKKPIVECSGAEIAQEWLYQMGVPLDQIESLANESCNTVPTYMPYITAYFMPRAKGDRPLVVPHGSKNLAFISNFAETERDTVFTTEYSVRTAMEAVYQLLHVDRGVPEVFASTYDLRMLLQAVNCLADGQKLSERKLPLSKQMLMKKILTKTEDTFIEELLEDYDLI